MLFRLSARGADVFPVVVSLIVSSLVVMCIPYAAHYVYPIRARFPNVIKGKTEWQTIGFVPKVRLRHGASAKEKKRARDVRAQLLQRCIAVLTDDFALASRKGKIIVLDGVEWTAVPRITLYAADMPEQRQLLGLRIGRSMKPCTRCMVSKDVCGVCSDALARNVRETLLLQMEAAELFDSNTGAPRRDQISDDHSATPFVPALGAIHGLSTGGAALYRIFGLDLLHVRRVVCSGSFCHRLTAGAAKSLVVQVVGTRRLTFALIPFSAFVWFAPLVNPSGIRRGLADLETGHSTKSWSVGWQSCGGVGQGGQLTLRHRRKHSNWHQRALAAHDQAMPRQPSTTRVRRLVCALLSTGPSS